MNKLTAASPEAQSADLVAGNIDQLKALFPDLITEGPNGKAVNVDVLKALVGDQTVTDADEKYGLNWHGKRRARQLALTPSTGTLRPCRDESVDWDTTQNLMIEGDNLEVLKLLQKSYAGKVKLIYIDPPYNTGKDFVYPDNFQDNIKNYLELTGQVEGGQKISSNTEASGRFHTDWLNMMYPRLKLARNLLRDDGVIFITIDDNEVFHLRQLLNDVFGEENFVANVVWNHTKQSKNDEKYFSRHHNQILVFRKSEKSEKFQFERSEENNRNYGNPDNDPKGDWRAGDVRSPNFRATLRFPIVSPSGNVIEPPENGWRWSEASIKEKIASGEIIFVDNETRILRKIYLADQDGRTPENLWSAEFAGTTRQANAELKELFDSPPFDTPKPISLGQRILSLITAGAENDIIVDFFAGSGATGHAVVAQNASDGGKRRYILVQLPEPLDPTNKDQKAAAEFCDKLGKPRTIAELTKERLRRAAAKVKADNPLFAGDIAIGKAGVAATEKAGAATVVLDEADIELPDLLTDLQDRTQLTRRTIVRVLTGSGRLDDFKRNPQQFIELAAETINRCKRLALVDGIKYQKLGDQHVYAQELFEKEELTGYLKNMLLDTQKSIYEHVVYDSTTERDFADGLEKNEAIKLYAKLPGWFKVPTPLGTYNPDWAVLVEEDGTQRLYFVVETKSSLFTDDLRDKESAKIECGKAHFTALGVGENPARYVVARSVGDLLTEAAKG